MRTLKIYKIAAIWILMVLMIAYSQATQPKLIQSELPLQNNIEEEMYLVGGYPKVEDIFEVVYRIRIIDTADWTNRENYLTKDYCAVIHAQSDATEMIGENIFFFSGLKLGETKEFRARCRIVKPWNWIQVTGHIALGRKGDVRGAVSAKGGIPLYLIDPKTGQYGTRKDAYEGIECRYEAATFGFMSGPDPAVRELNKKVIVMMRKMEPALSDSEALLLHSEIAQVGAPQEFHPKKFEKGMLPGEEYEEIYMYYLRNGWLKAVREGRHKNWLIQMKDSLLN
jgi:hypothetical protein